MQRILIWDLPTRLFHWLLVLCVCGSFISAKIGGSAMDKSDCLANFATDVVLLQHLGVKPVIVHGGGPEISGYMNRLGIEPRPGWVPGAWAAS